MQLIPWCYYIGVMICIAIGNTAEHSANQRILKMIIRCTLKEKMVNRVNLSIQQYL